VPGFGTFLRKRRSFIAGCEPEYFQTRNLAVRSARAGGNSFISVCVVEDALPSVFRFPSAQPSSRASRPRAGVHHFPPRYSLPVNRETSAWR
jgi:hypothetical protein